MVAELRNHVQCSASVSVLVVEQCNAMLCRGLTDSTQDGKVSGLLCVASRAAAFYSLYLTSAGTGFRVFPRLNYFPNILLITSTPRREDPRPRDVATIKSSLLRVRGLITSDWPGRAGQGRKWRGLV